MFGSVGRGQHGGLVGDRAGGPASTLISTVAFAPLAIVPSAHVTVLPTRTQLPCVAVADTKVSPAGSASLSDTLGALAGPALCTVSV